MSKKSFLVISLISTMLLVASAYGEERVKREMVINHVEQIGLEIWSENNPTWLTQVRKRGPKFEFVAETPRSYYPPAAMHYMHFADMEVKGGEMEGIALNAIQQAALNFGVPTSEISAIKPVPATYSEMKGYEAVFKGRANGEDMDIKMFIGNSPGKGPVSMYVYTMRGKLGHLSEPIRRAWQNVKYLN
jgi:uncharacterized protein YpuA (DUF1002 family)